MSTNEIEQLREDRDAFRASSDIRGAEVERLTARVAELERMINGCIDPDIIHAPSLTDLQEGDTFLYCGKWFEYLYLSKDGWHFTKELNYPFEVSVWMYDAEVDWLDG